MTWATERDPSIVNLASRKGRAEPGPDEPGPAGIAVFGVHPPSVDAASAYLMGFDPEKVPRLT